MTWSGRAAALSCVLSTATFLVADRLAAQGKPELVLHKTTYFLHGRIYTNDPKQPWASALAVRDEKILCVGSIEHILLDCGGSDPTAETFQLKGLFVMPGFNDAHMHIGGAARDKLALVLNGTGSAEELVKRVKEAVAQHKPGEWISGSGWDQTLWPDKKFPNRLQLDEVAPDNPVYLVHISGHVAVANTQALKHAEIAHDTPNPPGGEIERYADGEATGMLKEGSALAMVEQRIPIPRPKRVERELSWCSKSWRETGSPPLRTIRSGKISRCITT